MNPFPPLPKKTCQATHKCTRKKAEFKLALPTHPSTWHPNSLFLSLPPPPRHANPQTHLFGGIGEIWGGWMGEWQTLSIPTGPGSKRCPHLPFCHASPSPASVPRIRSFLAAADTPRRFPWRRHRGGCRKKEMSSRKGGRGVGGSSERGSRAWQPPTAGGTMSWQRSGGEGVPSGTQQVLLRAPRLGSGNRRGRGQGLGRGSRRGRSALWSPHRPPPRQLGQRNCTNWFVEAWLDGSFLHSTNLGDF